MLHPDQFEVNEAWIAFKLNDAPIHSEEDGDFDVIALMDAARGFILSSAPVSALRAGPTELESRRLLKDGHTHKKQWPRTLFIPTNRPARLLSAPAELEGINVIRVAEDLLLLFIGEARDSFREHFGSSGTRYDGVRLALRERAAPDRSARFRRSCPQAIVTPLHSTPGHPVKMDARTAAI